MRYSSSEQFSITKWRGVRWRGTTPSLGGRSGVLAALYRLFYGDGNDSGVLSEKYTLSGYEDNENNAILPEKYTLSGYEDNENNGILSEKYTLSGYEDNGDNAILPEKYTLGGYEDNGDNAVIASEYRLDIDTSEGITTAVFASEYVRG